MLDETLVIAPPEEIVGMGPSTKAEADDALKFCLLGASSAIERRVGRKLIKRSYDWILSGRRAKGKERDVLYLPEWPIRSVTSIHEAGSSLAFSTDYDPNGTAHVQVDTEEGRLYKRSTSVPAVQSPATAGRVLWPLLGWACGMHNVRVVAEAGYDPAGEDDPCMPYDLKLVAAELTWLMYKARLRHGVSSVTVENRTERYLRQLGGASQAILDGYRRGLRPTC